MPAFFSAVFSWLLAMGSGLVSKVLTAVIIAAIGTLVIHLIMNVVNKALEKSKLEKAAYSLIKNLAKTVMYVLLALCVASSVGIDVTGIVALASVLTLAVSLSVQNFLTNIIGGFTLLYTKPFHSGDYVEVASRSGTVKEIGMAYTKLITPDNKIISIPNSAVVSAEIVNYSTTGTRRLDINVSASYDAPAQAVIESLLEAVADDRVLTEPAKPFATLTGYGDSAINYVVRVWVKSGDYWDVNYLATRRIKEIFDAKGIEMTYPHLNVHLSK